MDISLSKFFYDFMVPDLNDEWPEQYLNFLNDFNKDTVDELFENGEDLIASTHKKFKENGDQVEVPTRLNVYFGARLVYMEQKWAKEVMEKHLKNHIKENHKNKILSEILNLVLDISTNERINIRNPQENTITFKTQYDIIEWRKQNMTKPLNHYHCSKKTISFKFRDNALDIINNFNKSYHDQKDEDYYYNAVDFILPKTNQLYKLSYGS